MLSCEEAQVICQKKQYREARFSEKVRLGFHILFCKACSGFSRKNNRLTQMICQADLHVLTEAEKERMKQRLQNPGDS
ncbi:MAG: hypothetical protein R3252_01420 [Robiginitalea sp.]|nr:hypothetical protein [Robiginitalea sp.]